jgi:hypothetical protein
MGLFGPTTGVKYKVKSKVLRDNTPKAFARTEIIEESNRTPKETENSNIGLKTFTSRTQRKEQQDE